MGRVEIEAASSAQLKGAKIVVAGIGGSEIGIGIGTGIGIGIGDLKDLEMIGNGGSICLGMVAAEDGGMIGEFVWEETEEVVVGTVWVATLIFDTRSLSQRSRSSRIPAENPSPKAASLDSCMRSAKSLEASKRRSSYCALSFSIASAKSKLSNWWPRSDPCWKACCSILLSSN